MKYIWGGILLITLLFFGILAIFGNSSSSGIYGKWVSVTSSSHSISFFKDGTMNIDGQLATYTWLDNQNIRLKYAGVLGTVNEWIGVDPILEVKIDHNPPEDTLVITNINGRIEQYHRAANSRYSRKEHKNDIKQPLN